jgi:hypothetical protein
VHLPRLAFLLRSPSFENEERCFAGYPHWWKPVCLDAQSRVGRDLGHNIEFSYSTKEMLKKQSWKIFL